MKKLLAFILSAVILVCCIVPVSAKGNYIYIAPSWLTFLGEDNGIKMWATPDYSSLLMLLTADNRDGKLVSGITSGQPFDISDFLGKEVTENFSIKSYDFRTVSGYDCLRATCTVKPGHESGTFLSKAYNYNMYAFTSTETVYLFVFGASASGQYNAAAFESTFNTFRINENMTTAASTLPADVTEEEVTESASESDFDGLIMYETATDTSVTAAETGKTDTGGKRALIVKALPFLALIALAAAVVLFFVLRKVIKKDAEELDEENIINAPEIPEELPPPEIPQQPYEEQTYLQIDMPSMEENLKNDRK